MKSKVWGAKQGSDEPTACGGCQRNSLRWEGIEISELTVRWRMSRVGLKEDKSERNCWFLFPGNSCRRLMARSSRGVDVWLCHLKTEQGMCEMFRNAQLFVASL